MKRIGPNMIVPILVFSFFGSCLAMQENIISEKNQYNGKTIEETYELDEDPYKDGITRNIIHYDNRGKIRQIESFYAEAQSSIDGIYSREQYYEQRRIKGPRLIKSVFVYTDAYSDTHGLTRAEVHYDENGNLSKEELWYSDSFAARKNYSKVEVLYVRGNPERRVYYDPSGAVVSSEEKKQVWKSQ